MGDEEEEELALLSWFCWLEKGDKNTGNECALGGAPSECSATREEAEPPSSLLLLLLLLLLTMLGEEEADREDRSAEAVRSTEGWAIVVSSLAACACSRGTFFLLFVVSFAKSCRL